MLGHFQREAARAPELGVCARMAARMTQKNGPPIADGPRRSCPTKGEETMPEQHGCGCSARGGRDGAALSIRKEGWKW
jgi:hypothetical protein